MLGPALALAVGLSWIPLYVFRPEEMRDALPYYSGAERRWVRGGPAIIAAHVTLGCVLLSFADPSPWLAAVAIGTLGALGACNTMAGLGEDTSAAGRAITRSADQGQRDANQTAAPAGCATALHQDRPGGTDYRGPIDPACPR